MFYGQGIRKQPIFRNYQAYIQVHSLKPNPNLKFKYKPLKGEISQYQQKMLKNKVILGIVSQVKNNNHQRAVSVDQVKNPEFLAQENIQGKPLTTLIYKNNFQTQQEYKTQYKMKRAQSAKSISTTNYETNNYNQKKNLENYEQLFKKLEFNLRKKKENENNQNISDYSVLDNKVYMQEDSVQFMTQNPSKGYEQIQEQSKAQQENSIYFRQQNVSIIMQRPSSHHSLRQQSSQLFRPSSSKQLRPQSSSQKQIISYNENVQLESFPPQFFKNIQKPLLRPSSMHQIHTMNIQKPNRYEKNQPLIQEMIFVSKKLLSPKKKIEPEYVPFSENIVSNKQIQNQIYKKVPVNFSLKLSQMQEQDQIYVKPQPLSSFTVYDQFKYRIIK